MSEDPSRNLASPRYESLSLQLPLRLAVPGRVELVDCVTESISSDEVRFVSPELLNPADRVEVDVSLPAHNPGPNARKIHLRCVVQVERIDPIRLGSGFRIECRIMSYTIRFGEAR